MEVLPLSPSCPTLLPQPLYLTVLQIYIWSLFPPPPKNIQSQTRSYIGSSGLPNFTDIRVITYSATEDERLFLKASLATALYK